MNRTISKYRKAHLSVILAALVVATCAFDSKEPKVENPDKFKIETIFVGSGTTALNSNNIRALKADGNVLWIATWGGGISSLDQEGNITTYRGTTGTDDISSDNCTAIGAKNGKAMATCIDSSGDYHVDSFGTNGWSKNVAAFPTTTAATPYTDIEFNGSNFFVLQDKRTNGYLELVMDNSPVVEGSQIIVRDNIGGSIAGLSNTNLQNFCYTQTGLWLYKNNCSDTCNPACQGTTNVIADGDYYNRAIHQMEVDREDDIIAVGSIVDLADSNSPASHKDEHLNLAWMHLALFRVQIDSVVTPTRLEGKNGDIDPMIFGAAWEVPLALGYADASSDGFIFENIYVASDKAFYRVAVRNYNNIFDVQKFTTDNGLATNNIRAIATKGNSQAWLASDKGVIVFESAFDNINTTTYPSLPSNNVQAIANFNGDIYAGTDQGLAKITEISQEESQ